MPYVALTGNFGTGKSTVLLIFEELGAQTINADTIVSNILKEKTIIKEIAHLFGKEVLTPYGSLDKKLLSSIVFQNPTKRLILENLLHPLVFERADKMKEAIKKYSPHQVIIFEVPLLFEGGYSQRFDKIIVVYCERKQAVERLISRGFTQQESLKRIEAQMDIEEKVRKADYVIDNTFDREKTYTQVLTIYNSLLLLDISLY
jgi:dephospho-CoA kinase